MKKLSFYTILCCLAVVCTFSLNSCQEFNIDSQAEFPPLLETDAQSEYAVLAKSPNTIIFNISSNTPWKIKKQQELVRTYSGNEISKFTYRRSLCHHGRKSG